MFSSFLLFLSTPSARRATAAGISQSPKTGYFYPRPPRGGRRNILGNNAAIQKISIHALREEGDQYQSVYLHELYISIHALREEGDIISGLSGSHAGDFYPRPPRGGRRHPEHPGCKSTPFLSTPSARRATQRAVHNAQYAQNHFYPRPPRGGRPGTSNRAAAPQRIFLSTPSARRATWQEDMIDPADLEFLSTPSARRATRSSGDRPFTREISIHALREEGDLRSTRPRSTLCYFYPRPPRGGRHP